MSKKANPAIIGAFVVGGLALLVVGIILVARMRFFRETKRVVVYFRQSVNGLRIGAAVKFKGIEIGTVQDIRLNLSKVRREPDRIHIPVVLEIDQDRLHAEGSYVDLNDPTVFPSMVAEGLRAQLDTDSLLTGLRYVSLDMRPGTPIELVADPTVSYPEIPSLPSADEELRQKAITLISNLSRADFEGLVRSARGLTEGARAVVTDPELLRAVRRLDRLTADLDGTVVELGRTAETFGPKGPIGRNLTSASKNAETLSANGADTAIALRQLVQPDGAFLTDLEGTLTELHGAARSLHRLTDQLSRDPGALLRGGPQ